MCCTTSICKYCTGTCILYSLQSIGTYLDLAEWLERLTANAEVVTVLGSIPASSDTVESAGRQMKQCWIKYKKIQISPCFLYIFRYIKHTYTSLIKYTYEHLPCCSIIAYLLYWEKHLRYLWCTKYVMYWEKLHYCISALMRKHLRYLWCTEYVVYWEKLYYCISTLLREAFSVSLMYWICDVLREAVLLYICSSERSICGISDVLNMWCTERSCTTVYLLFWEKHLRYLWCTK